ncbi:MAG: ABC transporter permease [Bacteroidota bacterium]
MKQLRWYFTMAWRDARPQWKRMILYILSVTIGIGALVAIQTFNTTIEDSVNAQSKTLLGADLEIEFETAFPDSLERELDTLGTQRATELRFASMVLHQNGGTRLSQIRGLEGAFPFYGAFTLQNRIGSLDPSENEIYIDEQLALLFKAQLGDSLKVGERWYRLTGIIQKIPGESALSSLVGPRVYIDGSTLHNSRLLQRGSQVEYKSYHKLDNPDFIESYAQRLDSLYASYDVDIKTVESQRRDLGRAMDNLVGFLNLVAFVALLLGAIGVGSSINVLAKQKQQTIALLRCLGAKASQAISIFVIQALALGFIGAAIGVLIGVGLVPLFPLILEGLLPFDIKITYSGMALLNGFGIGFLFTLLFVLIPLMPVRKASPLSTLRVTNHVNAWKDPISIGLFLLFTGAMTMFVYLQLEDLYETLGFMGGLVIALGLLTLLAWAIRWTFQRFFPQSASFTVRQGLANLYRPQNQTLLLIITIGLGTFLIATIFLMQDLLLKQIEFTAGKDQPNMVLYDIQHDQQDTIASLLDKYNLPALAKTPIVTMRLASVNGRSVADLKRDTTNQHDNWVLEREWRMTYRDSLTDAETVTEGEFIGRSSLDADLVPISIAQDILDDLRVGIGDTLTYDVQGIPIQTRVASIREVDWRRFSTNFMVVFPSGVLESAPQFFVMLTRYDENEVAAAFMRDVVQTAPNVSAVDMTLILNTVRDILDKIEFAVQFMALLSILTGLVVLISSLIINRDQRVKESVLLRTLGAVKAKVKRIQFVEFTMLGVIASLTGSLLAMGSSFALSKFVFESDFYINWLILGGTFLGVTAIVVAIGLSNSRGIADRPPLDILRQEM